MKSQGLVIAVHPEGDLNINTLHDIHLISQYISLKTKSLDHHSIVLSRNHEYLDKPL